MNVKGHRAALAIAVVGLTFLASLSGAQAAPKPPATPVAQALAIAQSYMPAPTKISQTIPLRVAPPKGLTVFFVTPNNPATVIVGAGIQEAAAAIGWNYDQATYDPANPASLQAALLTALQKKPAAVVTSGANPALISPSVLDQFAQAKIPIVMGGQCPLVPKVPVFPGGNLCANEPPMAKALANWVIADSNGSGKVLLQSMPAYAILVEFRAVFIAEMKARCPACSVEVLETTPAQLASNQIPSLLVNKLRSDSSIGYLFFDNGSWAKGIVPALNAVGLLGRVKVGGRALDEGALAAVQAGQEHAWTAIPYKLLGYADVDSVLRIVTKSSGITKNAVSPIQLVTNVNASSVVMPYMAPTNALALYKKLWRVG